MPVHLAGHSQLPLAAKEIEHLWKQTIAQRQYSDEPVNIRVISSAAIQSLNRQYRGKDGPTNVLTFSYPGEHDIAICGEVVIQEAQQLRLPPATYAAWVIVHAFVHATGLDHEHSASHAKEVKRIEQAILQAAGYGNISLLDS